MTRARRGQLASLERTALAAHLEECASCRVSQEIFGDFDRAPVVARDDGARLPRLGGVALRAHHRRFLAARRAARGRRVWRSGARVAVVGAIAVLAAGSASAGIWLWARPQAPPTSASSMSHPSSAKHAGRHARAGAKTTDEIAALASAAEETDVSLAGELAPVEAPPPAVVAAAPRVGVAVSARRSKVSAAMLLRHASDAHQRGDSDRAVLLYRRLQRELPRSREAKVAAVPLGRLLLDRGSPRSALSEFDRYLTLAGSRGALAPEALYGRALSLDALGRSTEERGAWERLVGEHPSSTYAAVGRRRLADAR